MEHPFLGAGLEIPAADPAAVLEGHSGFVADLAFSNDGRQLASASADQTVKLWNVETWDEEKALLGHTDEVWSVDYSPATDELMSSGKDGRILVWSLNDDYQNRGSQAFPFSACRDFDMSPDGKGLVAVTDGEIRLYETTYKAPPDLGSSHVAAYWPKPGEILLCSERPPRIKLWNLADDSIADFPLESGDKRAKFALLPNAGVIVASIEMSEEEVKFIRWDPATRQEASACTIEGVQLNQVYFRCFSPDGRWLAAHMPQSTVQVCDIVTGESQPRLKVRDTAYLHGMALTSEGTKLVHASYDNPEISVWDVKTRKPLLDLRGNSLVISVPGLSIAHDGQRIATATLGSEPIRLWDTRSWQRVASLETPPGTTKKNLKFLSDGNTIGVVEHVLDTGEARVRLWRAPTWEEIAKTEAKDPSSAGSGFTEKN